MHGDEGRAEDQQQDREELHDCRIPGEPKDQERVPQLTRKSLIRQELVTREKSLIRMELYTVPRDCEIK